MSRAPLKRRIIKRKIDMIKQTKIGGNYAPGDGGGGGDGGDGGGAIPL